MAVVFGDRAAPPKRHRPSVLRRKCYLGTVEAGCKRPKVEGLVNHAKRDTVRWCLVERVERRVEGSAVEERGDTEKGRQHEQSGDGSDEGQLLHVSNSRSVSFIPTMLLLWGMVRAENCRNYDHKRRNLGTLCGPSHVDGYAKGRMNHIVRQERDEAKVLESGVTLPPIAM